MQYSVRKKNTIRSKMKPIVNENEMSTNADVMDMTMLIAFDECFLISWVSCER